MLDATTSLSKPVDALERGVQRDFIIARNGRPAARLVPLSAAPASAQRRIGAAKGHFVVPDNIDTLNDEVAQVFGSSR